MRVENTHRGSTKLVAGAAVAPPALIKTRARPQQPGVVVDLHSVQSVRAASQVDGGRLPRKGDGAGVEHVH